AVLRPDEAERVAQHPEQRCLRVDVVADRMRTPVDGQSQHCGVSLRILRGKPSAAGDDPRVSANSRLCTTAPPSLCSSAMPRYSLTVDGTRREVEADADMPLLYALRGDLALKGPKFGCGLAQCGACTVILNGAATRSCVIPISAID